MRAATRVPRHALAQAREIGRGMAAMAGLVRPTPAVELERSDRSAPAVTRGRRSTVDDIKTVRKGLGGTFNDVVLAVITSGFRDCCWKRARSRPIASCARSCRCRSGPVTRAARPSATERSRTRCRRCSPSCRSASPTRSRGCARVRAQMEGLKRSNQAVAGEALTSLSGFAPPMLLALGHAGSRRRCRSATSTPSPRTCPARSTRSTCSAADAASAFPYVPLGGQMRIGVAIFSYDGQVNFGVTGDYDAAPDLDVLASGIEDGHGRTPGVGDVGEVHTTSHRVRRVGPRRRERVLGRNARRPRRRRRRLAQRDRQRRSLADRDSTRTRPHTAGLAARKPAAGPSRSPCRRSGGRARRGPRARRSLVAGSRRFRPPPRGTRSMPTPPVTRSASAGATDERPRVGIFPGVAHDIRRPPWKPLRD